MVVKPKCVKFSQAQSKQWYYLVKWSDQYVRIYNEILPIDENVWILVVVIVSEWSVNRSFHLVDKS